MRLPLRVSWLSENDLLESAAAILGYAIVPGSATTEGIQALSPGGSLCWLCWDGDELLFDLAQLAELGFELGSVTAMEQAICAKELARLASAYEDCRQCGGRLRAEEMGEGGICKQCWANKDLDPIKILWNEGRKE